MSNMNDPINARKQLDERIREGTKRCNETFGPEVEKLEKRLSEMPKLSRDERNTLKGRIHHQKVQEKTCVVDVTVKEKQNVMRELRGYPTPVNMKK